MLKKTKRKFNTKSAVFFRNLDHHVKQSFKTVCTRRGDSMQKIVEALMRLYIRVPDCIEKELKITKSDVK